MSGASAREACRLAAGSERSEQRAKQAGEARAKRERSRAAEARRRAKRAESRRELGGIVGEMEGVCAFSF